MHFGFHHLHKRQRGYKLANKAWVPIFEKVMYVGAFVGPSFTLPQVAKIWIDRNAGGVSLVTWVGYFLGAFLWLVYGYIHREKTIIIANFLSGVLALLVICGVLIYG